MLITKKAIKQKQVARTRVIQMKKISKRKNSGSLDQYKHNDYNIDKLQDCWSNSEVYLNKMEDFNIG